MADGEVYSFEEIVRFCQECAGSCIGEGRQPWPGASVLGVAKTQSCRPAWAISQGRVSRLEEGGDLSLGERAGLFSVFCKRGGLPWPMLLVPGSSLVAPWTGWQRPDAFATQYGVSNEVLCLWEKHSTQ